MFLGTFILVWLVGTEIVLLNVSWHSQCYDWSWLNGSPTSKNTDTVDKLACLIVIWNREAVTLSMPQPWVGGRSLSRYQQHQAAPTATALMSLAFSITIDLLVS